MVGLRGANSLVAVGPLVLVAAAGCTQGTFRTFDADVVYSSDSSPPPIDAPCPQEPTEANDPECTGAVFVGSLEDFGQSVEVVGNIAPSGDVDFYQFQAIDSLDFSCDTFHVRVQFLTNPDDSLVFDVWQGGCAAGMVCDSVTAFDWYTNFSSGGVGECPCSPTAVNNCADDTSEYVVRVRRKDALPPSCADYTLEISNGVYPGS